ncbi:MAG: MarR family transcriptional regulator [Phyllobacteriaceae bacterium]|nr:winged helix-turn-helix transcriptional regulator [Nitratireductor sp.]MCO5133420.1 MarR family transcriptional regulator [Phyllobacteriaceae bacterium]
MDIRADQALRWWKRVCLEQVLDDRPDLTLRQLTILLTIYLDPPPHTVRGLAARLGVTKPVITRALNAMGAMGLVERRRDERDRRNVLVRRTVEGSLFLEKLSDTIVIAAREELR